MRMQILFRSHLACAAGHFALVRCFCAVFAMRREYIESRVFALCPCDASCLCSSVWSFSFPRLRLLAFRNSSLVQSLDMLASFNITWSVRRWIEDDGNTISFRDMDSHLRLFDMQPRCPSSSIILSRLNRQRHSTTTTVKVRASSSTIPNHHQPSSTFNPITSLRSPHLSSFISLQPPVTTLSTTCIPPQNVSTHSKCLISNSRLHHLHQPITINTDIKSPSPSSSPLA